MKTAIPQGTRNFVAVIRAPFGRAVHRVVRRVSDAAAAMLFYRLQRGLYVASAQAAVELIVGPVRFGRKQRLPALRFLPRSHVAARVL